MRWIALLLLLVPSFAMADPPKVEPANPVAASPGDWVPFSVEAEKGKTIVREADASQVAFITDDDGQRYAVLKPGVKGPIVIRFWHAGESIKLPSKPPLPSLPVATLTITVGKPAPTPPDPKDPPTLPTTGLYFAIVRADGPASPEFTKIARDPAWKSLRDKGHLIKDFQVSDVDRLGIPIPSGTSLPCVVTLQQGADSSRVVRPAIPLPTTSDAILALPQGVNP